MSCLPGVDVLCLFSSGLPEVIVVSGRSFAMDASFCSQFGGVVGRGKYYAACNSKPPRPEAPRSGLEGRSRRRQRGYEPDHPLRPAFGAPQDEVVGFSVVRSSTLGVTAARKSAPKALKYLTRVNLCAGCSQAGLVWAAKELSTLRSHV